MGSVGDSSDRHEERTSLAHFSAQGGSERDATEQVAEELRGETSPDNPNGESRVELPKRSASATVPPPENAAYNFILLAAYQVVVRVGWIFKTESIIIPAVMDLLGGSPALRGCLPMLNRFGQSIPPLLLARRVKITPKKKHGLSLLTVAMSACFLVLAIGWLFTSGKDFSISPYLFLLMYALFFASTGVSNLYFNTVQGKLIAVERRGRQLLVANLVGPALAIGFAMVLLSQWLSVTPPRIDMIFGFTSFCFFLAAMLALTLKEKPDDFRERPFHVVHLVKNTVAVFRDDSRFRTTAAAAATFGATMMLFPHYQALGREKLGFELKDMMIWVVVQNSGTAIFSTAAGVVADRFGNRRVLRWGMLLLASAPLLCLTLLRFDNLAATFFPIVFGLVGLTPVLIKVFTNYSLELSPPEDHAKYVSTLGFCISLPIMIVSPIAGWLIGIAGFEVVFGGSLFVIFLGWCFTLLMDEPRWDDGAG